MEWEDKDFEFVSANRAVNKTAWKDEDADSDNIKDTWEESESSQDELPTPTNNKSVPVTKKKVSVAQRIAERNAENELLKKLSTENSTLQKPSNVGTETKEEQLEKRIQQKALEQEADLENTTDLFSGVSIKGNMNVQRLMEIQPKTKPEFDEFISLLVGRIESFQNHGLYAQFVNDFCRQLCLPLKDVDVRRVSSTLTTLSNEKQRASKDKTKKKGASVKKPTVALKQVGILDTTDYTNYEDLDDLDDFM